MEKKLSDKIALKMFGIKRLYRLSAAFVMVAVAMAGLLAAHSCGTSARNVASKSTLKLVYWNIQNGMWSGQDSDYGAFVDWVKAQEPDVCVWCEGESVYLSDSDKLMPKEDRYLIGHWGELAARYGHKYWAVSGHRDPYPQIVTSRYPIETVEKIIGEEPDSVVTHGAGWFRLDVGGRKLNIVTLHTWPMGFAYRAQDKDSSAAVFGGDKYRRKEMEYICGHTIATDPDAASNLWMMMGDFNSRSRVDNYEYAYADDDLRFLVHDYISGNTPYVDVVAGKHPGKFISSFAGGSRIDFLYCTPALYDRVVSSEIIWDGYTTPVRDPKGLSNFWHPSDHLPIVTVFDLR